jgi:hypothetical protein
MLSLLMPAMKIDYIPDERSIRAFAIRRVSQIGDE